MLSQFYFSKITLVFTCKDTFTPSSKQLNGHCRLSEVNEIMSLLVAGGMNETLRLRFGFYQYIAFAGK